MDNIVDALNNSYQDFVGALTGIFEANRASDCQVTATTIAAKENLKQKWKLYRVACDQAELFVESLKLRIVSECVVDDATCSVAGKPGPPLTPGLPPISAVWLEQMSKTVRWLVIELEHGSESVGSSSVPQQSEDSTQ